MSGGRTLAGQERRFALALLAPALLLLVLTTTAPLVYLVWNSLHRLDLGMPWLSGFAGLENYARMGADPRFWNSLWLTVVYTGSTVVLQVLVGLGLALLVLQIPKGQGVLRVAAILPIVLAPVVVGLILGPLAEQQLRRALAIAQGDPVILVSSPAALVLYGIAIVAVLVPLILRLRGRGKVLAQLASDED